MPIYVYMRVTEGGAVFGQPLEQFQAMSEEPLTHINGERVQRVPQIFNTERELGSLEGLDLNISVEPDEIRTMEMQHPELIGVFDPQTGEARFKTDRQHRAALKAINSRVESAKQRDADAAGQKQDQINAGDAEPHDADQVSASKTFLEQAR